MVVNPTRYTQTLRKSSKYFESVTAFNKFQNDDQPFQYLTMKIWRLKQQERYISLNDFNDCVNRPMLLLKPLMFEIQHLLVQIRRNPIEYPYNNKLSNLITVEYINNISGIKNDIVMYLISLYCEMPTIDYISLLELNKLFDNLLMIDTDQRVRLFDMISFIYTQLPDYLTKRQINNYDNNNINNNVFASPKLINNNGNQRKGSPSLLWFNQIRFQEPAVKFTNLQKLQDIIIEPIQCKSAGNFSMRHSKYNNKKLLSNDQKNSSNTQQITNIPKYDRNWMIQQLPNYDPVIIDCLRGQLQAYRTKTNDELQNILLEVLGGDNKMKFIEIVIANRKQIVEKIDLDELKLKIQMDLQLDGGEKCPIISKKQITVQTREQKQLIKKVLKENNKCMIEARKRQAEEED